MKINYLSETAITITLGDGVSIDNHLEVMHFCSFINNLDFEWIIELVPAYASVSVFVDVNYFQKNEKYLKDLFFKLYENFEAQSNILLSLDKPLIELKVRYSGEDLTYVSEYTKLDIDEVIKLHSETEYVVAMIGFTPGFPYLLGLDSRLIVPRRSIPRLRVPKGAVAIGGSQTGIYPKESPGGWHVIGFIEEELFDVTRPTPNLLQPGDRVKFNSVSIF